MILHTVLSGLGFFIFYQLFKQHAGWTFIQPLFPLGACYVLANSVAADWYLQGREKFRLIAIRNFILRSAGLVILFLLVRSPADYYTYYWIIVVSVILTAAYNLYWIQTDLRAEQTLPETGRTNWRELFIFFIATVFISITDFLDATFLGVLSNEAEVGFYTNAAKLVRLSLLVTLALNAVVFPQFAGFHSNEGSNRSREVLGRAIDWLIFLTIPVSILYLLFARELVHVFSGPAFEQSIASVQWMAPIPLFISLSNLLLYYGLSSRPHLHTRIAIGVAAGIAISAALNSWLIPQYGAMGAAMNSAITECGFMLFFLAVIKPVIPYASVGKAVVSCLVFIPIFKGITLLELSDFEKLLLGGMSCLGVYVGIQHFYWKHPFLDDLRKMLNSTSIHNRVN